MKIVISPAKSLDYEKPLPVSTFSQPQFLEEAALLNAKLEKKSKKAIGALMHISDALAALNYQRYKEFEIPFTVNNARPAVYAFNGDVYQGLDVYSFSPDHVSKLQDSLRILSGMYGVLRPLDLMQPYRLEMGTDLTIQRKKNLYQFWGSKVTDAINKELDGEELFVNLASQEYFKVIQPKNINAPVVSPVFKDFKNGKLKIISFFAKKARGSMVRYLIDSDAKTLNDIKGFNYDGYGYSEEYTENENEPVFVR